MQNRRIFNGFRQSSINFHINNNHYRTMVCHHSCNLLKQENKITAILLYNDRRLALFYTDGFITAVWYQQLFIDKVLIKFQSVL